MRSRENAKWRLQDDELLPSGYAVDAVAQMLDSHRRPAPLVRYLPA